MEKALKAMENRLLIYSFSLAFYLLFIFAVVKYPEWYIWIEEDDSPHAYMQLLILCSCFVTGLGIYLIQTLDNTINIKEKFIWISAAFGYLFLAIESKYEFHNQVRRVLEVKDDFPIFLWFERGDFMLTLFLVAGLIFSAFFFKYLKQSKRALIIFFLGAAFAVVSVGIDSFHLDKIISISENMEFVLEEVGESMAMLCFLNSTFSMFCFYLKQYINRISSSTI